MAKAKIEKSLYLRIIINREEENVDEFRSKCTNFWAQFFNLHDDKIFNPHHGYTDDSFWFDLHCPSDKERKLRDLIKKRAKEFDVKVELEEKKEEKWIPFHEMALKFLKTYTGYHGSIINFIRQRLKIPKEAIPELITLLKAHVKFLKRNIPEYAKFQRYKDTLEAIENLKEQQEEE